MSGFERIELSADFMAEFHKEHPEFADMSTEGWCECEQESDPLFHSDGVMPMDNCVEKHHYHCGWCLGISQIG